ncbi:MAG: hypothetical protein AAB885_02580 [Patescibacteria group bacterium]
MIKTAKTPIHKELAAGRWFNFSLAEQLGNIGSEVSRAERWREKDEKLFWGAVERALELFDLTLDDPRWKGRRLEIARAREVFCDAVYGGKLYGSSFKGMQNYFDQFAMASTSPVILTLPTGQAGGSEGSQPGDSSPPSALQNDSGAPTPAPSEASL